MHKIQADASMQALMTLLGTTDSTADGTLRGKVFESLVARAARKGPVAELTALQPAGASSMVHTRSRPAPPPWTAHSRRLRILPAPVVEFTVSDLAAQVALHPRCHYRPSSQTFPGVDKVLAVVADSGDGSSGDGGSGDGGSGEVHHIPVQCTVAATHDIVVGVAGSRTGLRLLADVFRWSRGRDTAFVFAVPQHLLRAHDDVWVRDQRVAEGAAGTGGRAGLAGGEPGGDFFAARFKQWVWGVPTSDLTRAALAPLMGEAGGDAVSALEDRVRDVYRCDDDAGGEGEWCEWG